MRLCGPVQGTPLHWAKSWRTRLAPGPRRRTTVIAATCRMMRAAPIWTAASPGLIWEVPRSREAVTPAPGLESSQSYDGSIFLGEDLHVRQQASHEWETSTSFVGVFLSLRCPSSCTRHLDDSSRLMSEARGARFPDGEGLRRELCDAGFEDARIHHLGLERRFSRHEAMKKLRGRAYSTFTLMADAEYQAGVDEAERLLPPEVVYELRLLNVVATRPQER
jgi:hypothetical protein